MTPLLVGLLEGDGEGDEEGVDPPVLMTSARSRSHNRYPSSAPLCVAR
jgi:hypothetical protein